jgi:hypothetical protein
MRLRNRFAVIFAVVEEHAEDRHKPFRNLG